uniref:Ubiquitin-activating enzyme E1 1 n=1 Tax=Rhizophora mucronata TaxID=61149 RepID=A0A2P2MDS2_RHIMU
MISVSRMAPPLLPPLVKLLPSPMSLLPVVVLLSLLLAAADSTRQSIRCFLTEEELEFSFSSPPSCTSAFSTGRFLGSIKCSKLPNTPQNPMEISKIGIG